MSIYFQSSLIRFDDEHELCEYFEFCYSFLNVAVVGEYRERDIERYRARVSSNGEE